MPGILAFSAVIVKLLSLRLPPKRTRDDRNSHLVEAEAFFGREFLKPFAKRSRQAKLKRFIRCHVSPLVRCLALRIQ